MSQARPGPDEPEERPSWLLPAIVFAITAAIGAVILLLYVGPSLDDLFGGGGHTAEGSAVTVTLGPRTFAVPVNYIHLPEARGGGALAQIALDALLPDMRGFSSDDAEAIRDVTRDSPVVSIVLKAGAPELAEADRLERIYRRGADPQKPAYDYAGFKVLTMAANSGYGGEQVFAHQAGPELAVFVCSQDTPEHEIGALCRRETAYGDGLTLIYAFRGGHLTDWQNVDAAVKALLARLETKPG